MAGAAGVKSACTKWKLNWNICLRIARGTTVSGVTFGGRGRGRRERQTESAATSDTGLTKHHTQAGRRRVPGGSHQPGLLPSRKAEWRHGGGSDGVRRACGRSR